LALVVLAWLLHVYPIGLRASAQAIMRGSADVRTGAMGATLTVA